MPLTREKKQQVVSDVGDLLNASKMTVVASYQGTAVKDMQSLRKKAKENGTTVKVIKNRLVVQALKNNEKYSNVDLDDLSGMLVYAFNNEDEVAPAQSLAAFAKTNPTLDFVGALAADGKWLDRDEVTSLAALPNKPQLIGQVIALLYSPIRSVVSATRGQLPSIISGLELKAKEQ